MDDERLMNRYDLIQMLDRYLDGYPSEADMVSPIVSLVEGHADCFLRTCRPGHITGSAWVVSADHRRAALVHHRKLGRWLQPGGHADGEGDIAKVARKEAEEETGLADLTLVGRGGLPAIFDVDIHQIPARFDAAGRMLDDAHDHHDLRFLFIASEASSRDAALQVSDESHGVGWFDEAAIRSLTGEQSVLRMLEKAAVWLG